MGVCHGSKNAAVWEIVPPSSYDPNPYEEDGEVLYASIYYDYQNDSPDE